MDWWMTPAYRPMMCDHLRNMIGETMRAEVRHPGGMRTYTGRLVSVGDDFIELEMDDVADDRPRAYDVEASAVESEPEQIYPMESGEYDDTTGSVGQMGLTPLDERSYGSVESYGQEDTVEGQQFYGAGPFSRLLVPLALLSTLYTFPRRRPYPRPRRPRRYYW
ncbi:hypothetical protein F9B85_06200 [Heliorestis acidaminivorans]|uniref:Uncharacterized protein n=1 Tax=Heliorestis acidaminivorans TaxID=553427 RepID=A0A6I0EX67_9FIRM|nr:hypothetical protein [Heliorestis acidaminivorans]KAB2952870.1 hypothetical protein F9B85_06200 [Heliorestis acidaminivorans]